MKLIFDRTIGVLGDFVKRVLDLLLCLLHEARRRFLIQIFEKGRVPSVHDEVAVAIGGSLTLFFVVQNVKRNRIDGLHGQVWMNYYLFPSDAFLAIVLKCLLEEFEALQAELNFFGPLPFAFAHTILELLHGLGVKYIHVRQQGKVETAQRPHIDFVIVPTTE